MQKYVVIAAGGEGKRARQLPPKQLAVIAGRPVLMHALIPFLEYDPSIRIVISLPASLHPAWQALCEKFRFTAPHKVVPGGPTRFHSVKMALQDVPDGALVAVHDGVRPLAGRDLVERVFNVAARSGNAIPAVAPDESLRRVDHALSTPLPRNSIRVVQTPQCFLSSQLKAAYNQNYREAFTDDASVLETSNLRIFLVEGEKTNIKVTHPTDLAVAEALLKKTR